MSKDTTPAMTRVTTENLQRDIRLINDVERLRSLKGELKFLIAQIEMKLDQLEQ